MKFVGFRQNSRPEDVCFIVDESDVSAVTAGVGGLDEGASQGVIFKNGTGDYTITLNRVGRRAPVIMGVVPQTEDLTYKATVVSNGVIRVIFAMSGTDTNTDFHISIRQFFASASR